ncbi:MAG: HRDC domain-containing protein [Actinomycetaceae bacterium]|nr:HRDC domain-containing protein [Actinomycetaceae bacterium]
MLHTPEGTTHTPTSSTTSAQLVTSPAGGVPHIVDTPEALAHAVRQLASGNGPFAIDAERASSFRYGQDAYLIQVKRAASGIHLIDPRAFDTLAPLATVLAEDEWVLHAADQDLPCLDDLGLRPPSLFDTEIAAHILNYERIGLSSVLENRLGVLLAKEHSSADWSTRPLPSQWLAYAALDVEFLLPLRELLMQDLVDAGKDEWAKQEFEHVRTAPPPAPKLDPWRHTPGSGEIRTTRGLAVLRELWLTRDSIAQSEDLSPSKVLGNKALVAASVHLPADRRRLGAMPEFRSKSAKAHMSSWAKAISKALALDEDQLPERRAPKRIDATPDPRNWHRHSPDALIRLEAIRHCLREEAQDLGIPPEVLLAPKTQRRSAWLLPFDCTVSEVKKVLAADKARPWQIAQVALPITHSLRSE